MELEIQVLDKQSMLGYINKVYDSANSAMKHIEHYPITTDGWIDRSAGLEIQKINGVCRFLDGLLDGRTFISLPPECTLEDTKRLLDQIQLAEGVRAIAIKLDDSHEATSSNTLTTAPRLYLALTDKPKPSESDRYFEEILDALTMTCKLPTSGTALSTSTCAGSEEQKGSIGDQELVLPSSTGERPVTEQSERITPLPVEPIEGDHPTPHHHHHPESLRIEIPARRSNSVPDAFSIPWVHQSIPGWRNTSMPSWTLCTHDHHHRHEHFEVNTPSLVSPTSSVETIVDGDVELVSPTYEKGIQSSCMHIRELSSDTAMTAATSVYSDNDTIEGNRPKIGEQDICGLGMRNDRQFKLQDHQYFKHAQGIRGNDSMDNRNERSIESGNHLVASEQGNGKDFNTFYAGSRQSLIRGRGNRLPPPGTPFYKMEQPPCNRHYLLEEGCFSKRCQYAHDYLLSKQEIERLRNDSRKSPCSSLNMGKECYIGPEKCHMGHYCPYGKECRYGIHCRFLRIPGAHDDLPVNEYSAHQARFQRGELTTVIIRDGHTAPPPSPPITPPPFINEVHNLLSPTSPSARSPVNQGFQTAAVRNARPAYDNAPFPLRISIPMTPPAHKLPIRSLVSPPPLLFPPQPFNPPHHLQPFYQIYPPATMRPVDSYSPSSEFGQMPPTPNMMVSMHQPLAVPVTTMPQPSPPMGPSGVQMHMFYPLPPAPLGRVDGPFLPSPPPALLEAPRATVKQAEENKDIITPPTSQVVLKTKAVVNNNTSVLKRETQIPLLKSGKPKKENRKAFVSNKRPNNLRTSDQA